MSGWQIKANFVDVLGDDLQKIHDDIVHHDAEPGKGIRWIAECAYSIFGIWLFSMKLEILRFRFWALRR